MQAHPSQLVKFLFTGNYYQIPTNFQILSGIPSQELLNDSHIYYKLRGWIKSLLEFPKGSVISLYTDIRDIPLGFELYSATYEEMQQSLNEQYELNSVPLDERVSIPFVGHHLFIRV